MRCRHIDKYLPNNFNVHSVKQFTLQIYNRFSVQQGSSAKEHITLKIMRQKTVKEIVSAIERHLDG